MSWQRLVAASSVALFLAIPLGCSPQPRERPVELDDYSGELPKRDAAPPTEAGSYEPPPSLEIEDIEITGCGLLEAERAEVYGRHRMTALHRLQRAGDGWMAEAIWESGFVVFDDAGANASPGLVTTGTLDRAFASGSSIWTATVDSQGVQARQYDFAGDPMGPLVHLSSDLADEVAIGASGEIALAVWSTARSIAARGITESTLGAPYELQEGVLSDGSRIVMADAGNGELAIAWSNRRVADSHHRVFFVRASPSGVLGPPHTLIDALEPHEVVALEKGDDGYALLLQRGGKPLLMLLNSWGDPVGVTVRYLGMGRAHDVALGTDGEMALAASLEDGRDALLRLDSNGRVVGDVLCLEPMRSYGEHAVSVAATERGFAVLYRSADDEELLTWLPAID